uniref:Ion transport domain-containing protein n=1 Tax=Psilocybe cubensis TaxID=181762 RepID=A0A8H7XT63_PSICU
MSESQPELQPLLSPEQVASTPVYPIIHMIRADVMHYIDTPLTYTSLTSPDLTYTLVRPLVDKYLAIQDEGNLSVVFCFLINCVHFIRDDNVATMSLSQSRANLCEILATRVFRENANNLLHLTMALTTSWPVYSGVDAALITRARDERDDDLEDHVGNAIEMAILGKSKRFIKSSSCQKVIDAIWSGKCVYQAQSSHSILSDTYKRNPIHFYDPHKAPLLDHYRLKVPSIRSVLDYLNFLILFILFVVAIEFNERDRINASEVLFMVYALGFTLEKVAAMQEHGIKVYFKGTWNGFDLAFVTTFLIYTFLRLYGVYHHKTWARILGIDVLALIACLMFPRLAFVTFKDSLLVLSLRAMIMQFMFLMVIAAFCFCGFLYALWTLSRDDASYSAGLIAWWMLDLWFGLDASGFDRATTFHPIFGPVLMVTYACLSNTLLLTVLVSILSNTFASVNEDAAAEVVISLYERQSKQAGTTNLYETLAHMAEKAFDTLPRSLKRMTFFEGLAGADADIDAVFDLEDEFGNESALDTGDNGNGVSIRSQRRLSGHSTRRGRVVRQSSPGRMPRYSTSPQRMPRHSSPSKPIPQARARLNSAMNHENFSPLAQVFNPLLVEDDHITDQGPAMSSGISYGPATRRRLTSFVASNKNLAPDISMPSISNPSKKFGDKSSPSEQGILISGSHDLLQPPQHISTATEIKDAAEEDTGESREESAIISRLEEIERRQQRIESLLTRISHSIDSKKVD